MGYIFYRDFPLIMLDSRGQYGTGPVSRKILSPRDRVPDFLSLRDSPE